MNKQPTSVTIQDADREREITDYLHLHPDFFQRHPELLAEMDLSHQCGEAVSLIERQVTTLRAQNRKTRAQLEELVRIARDNDALSERMHRLTTTLMDAQSLNDVYIALDDSLRGDFQADAMSVKLFIDPEAVEIDSDNELMQTIFMPINDPRLSEYRNILSHEKPICGKLKTEQLLYLFGDVGTSIQSTAMIPLGGDLCTSVDCPYLGVLAIGSRDPQRFHPKMGTLFLSHLGDILSRAIKPYIIHKDDLSGT
ncbi:MAG: DUF484 family protein [Gammaproteobacteria bacterium]|nr:DUF484 family protein [Gammaproteobacteria bacterium]